jgi:hypothetical protein
MSPIFAASIEQRRRLVQVNAKRDRKTETPRVE